MFTWKREQHGKRELAKDLYRTLSLQRSKTKTLLFVIGCQRSGTTMMMRAFALDWRSKTYGETGLSGVNKWKLADAAVIADRLARQRAPFHVVKPLCDSQNVGAYLEQLPQAKAIWLYRDYHGVARSNLARWGFASAKQNLRPLVTGDGADYWATEGATAATAAIVQRYFDEAMAPNDAAALFWYVRNRLYFDLELVDHPQVRLYQYEDLVQRPAAVLRSIYAFVEQPYPGDHIVSHIHAGSLAKGKSLALTPAIEELCTGLQQQLDACYALSRKQGLRA